MLPKRNLFPEPECLFTYHGIYFSRMGSFSESCTPSPSGELGVSLWANASMMIKPKKAPDIPLPMQAPERIFIEPMEVLPQAIQAPVRQSTFAPIMSGLIQGAGQIGMGIAGQMNYQSPNIGGGSYGSGGFGTFGNYSGLSGQPY